MDLVHRPAPRLALAALAAAGVASGVAGCGAHGQPAALEACKSYANGTSGVQTAGQRDALLTDAQRWAAKAAAKAPQWTVLVQAIRDYRSAADADQSSRRTRQRLADAEALIRNSCELAARGY
jgi:hypothetical protein